MTNAPVNIKTSQPKSLSTSQVTVTSAKIEVKVLMIGKRQMTQSVFRQIIDENCFALNAIGEVIERGKLLGLVNLHNKDCPLIAHWHVLFDLNGVIRKDIIFRDYLAYNSHHNIEDTRDLIEQQKTLVSYTGLALKVREYLDQLIMAG